MGLVKTNKDNGTLFVYLMGHIDSSNAQEVEDAITNEKTGCNNIVIDASDLEYISRIHKSMGNLVLEHK